MLYTKFCTFTKIKFKGDDFIMKEEGIIYLTKCLSCEKLNFSFTKSSLFDCCENAKLHTEIRPYGNEPTGVTLFSYECDICQTSFVNLFGSYNPENHQSSFNDEDDEYEFNEYEAKGICPKCQNFDSLLDSKAKYNLINLDTL